MSHRRIAYDPKRNPIVRPTPPPISAPILQILPVGEFPSRDKRAYLTAGMVSLKNTLWARTYIFASQLVPAVVVVPFLRGLWQKTPVSWFGAQRRCQSPGFSRPLTGEYGKYWDTHYLDTTASDSYVGWSRLVQWIHHRIQARQSLIIRWCSQHNHVSFDCSTF